jgi:hypothetical protein
MRRLKRLAEGLRSVAFAVLAIALSGSFPNFTLAGTKAEELSSAGPGMYSTYIDTRSRYFSDDLRKPHPMAMQDLLPALMEAIDRLSKYTVPDSVPPVHRVPHAKIEDLVCGGKKCAALAAYAAGEGIYIDDALEPETDVFARSVLLHELVHYVQDVSNELVGADPCQRWSRREQQAYAIQMRFLSLAESESVVAAYIGSTGVTCPPKVGKPLQLDEPQT